MTLAACRHMRDHANFTRSIANAWAHTHNSGSIHKPYAWYCGKYRVHGDCMLSAKHRTTAWPRLQATAILITTAAYTKRRYRPDMLQHIFSCLERAFPCLLHVETCTFIVNVSVRRVRRICTSCSYSGDPELRSCSKWFPSICCNTLMYATPRSATMASSQWAVCMASKFVLVVHLRGV